ncbi:MAG: shikimate dehydrogenase [Gammaproteobacteria bacterium]|nr:shikimate dehydrogenase [Gammaproteobacteria bacterium]
MDRYGVMGYPISHSRSPVIHRLFALQTGQDIQYELLRVSPEKLETAVRQFQRTGGRGLNVTVPHKTEVARLVDQMTERARTAGAVNTLVFRGSEIHGDNTDGIGLLRDLSVNLGISLEGIRILILGAGGATRGIIGPLLEMRPRSIVIANRTIDKAHLLAEHFESQGPVSACRFNVVPVTKPYDLVINATSAGLHGDTPPYPAAAVTKNTICYDLSYGLNSTPFSVWAREQGAAKSVMGWGMLVEQAAESFKLWRGIRPDTAPVLKQIHINA